MKTTCYLLAIAPDLVVEILSSGESRRKISERLKDYDSIGVKECWLVSPEAETIEVVDLSGNELKTTALYGTDSRLGSSVIPGLSLALTQIFK